MKKETNNQDYQSSHNTKREFLSRIVTILVLTGMIGWGLFESIFGQQAGFVAKVGKKTVKEEELSAYISSLERQMKEIGLPKPEGMGIAKIALEELILTKIIEQDIENFGIIIDEDSIVNFIINQPGFSKVTREQLDNIKKNNSTVYENIIDISRKQIFLNAINPSLVSNTYGSKTAFAKLLQNKYEVRSFTLFQINPYSVRDRIKNPTKEDLLKIYNSETYKFQRPAEKVVSIINTKNITIPKPSDKEIQEHYKRNAFTSDKTSEMRNIDILTTEEKDTALKALKMIKSNDISSIAKELKGISLQKLRKVKRSDLENSIQDKIFHTEIGKPTSILESNGRFIIAITKDIFKNKNEFIPSSISLQKEITKEIRCIKIDQIKNKIMEMLSARVKLKEVAKTFKVNLNQMIINQNNFSETEIYSKMGLSSKSISEINNGAIGYTGVDKMENSCDMSFFVIDEIIPEQKIPFQNVQSELIKIHKSNTEEVEMFNLYLEFTSELAKNSNKSATQIAKEMNISSLGVRIGNMKQVKEITSTGLNVKEPFAEAIFSTNKNKIAGPFKADYNKKGFVNSVIFAIVNNIQTVNIKELDSLKVKKLKEKIKNENTKKYSTSYNNNLKIKYKPSVSKEYKEQLQN